MSDKYYDAVERFADKYSNTRGVVSSGPDQFGADVIVVMFDDLHHKDVNLPKVFEGYEVYPVGIYALRDTYEMMVNRCMVEEPSIWDVNYKVPFKDSLDNLENIIDSYEDKVAKSVEGSLLQIKDTLQWIVSQNPDLQKNGDK